MRSQKPDANKDAMDPLEQVAILDNHLYLLRSLWSCEFVIDMYEAHIIFVITIKRYDFGFILLCFPAQAPWSISVVYHCWLCRHCCTCAGCCATIRAAWGSPCTDCILSSSILLLALGMPWNHRPKWITNNYFFLAGLFFLESRSSNQFSIKTQLSRKEGSRGGGKSGHTEQHLNPNIPRTRSRNTKGKPIAGGQCRSRNSNMILTALIFVLFLTPPERIAS